MKKMMIYVACSLCITVAMTNDRIYAKNDEKKIDERFDSYEQYENAPSYYSDEYQIELQEKIADAKQELAQIRKSRTAGRPNKLKIAGYFQENGYFCGPASAQNVIHYITGKKISQSTLADKNNLKTTAKAGTGVENMSAVLSKKTGKNYTHTLNRQYNFFSALIPAIYGNRPVVYNVNTKVLNSNYPFESGHYVVGTGFTDDEKYVYYFDVYTKVNVKGERKITRSTMNNAINAQTGYYIW